MSKVKASKPAPKEEAKYAIWDEGGGDWVTKPKDEDHGRYLFPKSEVKQVIDEYIKYVTSHGDQIEGLQIFQLVGVAAERKSIVYPKDF